MRQLVEDRVLFGSLPRSRGDVCGGKRAGLEWGRWGVGAGMGVSRCPLEETGPDAGLDGNNATAQQLHAPPYFGGRLLASGAGRKR